MVAVEDKGGDGLDTEVRAVVLLGGGCYHKILSPHG